MARTMCNRCRRPETVCYCAALPRLETTTRIVILQHPRERDMPIGTARMTMLSVANASLRVGMTWTRDELGDVLDDPARPAILLAPGPDARDILRDPPAGPVTLIVVDGTWAQARSLLNRNPLLQTLPRYAFTAPEPSRYRIRREPKPEYVSTIEAVMHVLGALEGDPEIARALLDPLDAMVDAQLHCQAIAPRRSSYRRPRGPKPPAPSRVPRAIASRFGDVVCVVGEANAWAYTRGKPRLDGTAPPFGGAAGRVRAPAVGELVHWVAHRPSTGETFERVMAPAGELSPNTPFHIELDEARLRAGSARADMVSEFSRFLRPRDVVCAWGHYPHALFIANGGAPFAEPLDLRAAAQRIANRKIGTLEAFAATLAATPPAPIALGRAGRRLAMLVEIVRDWHRAAST